MTPRARRLVITLIVLAVALGVVLITVLGPRPQPPPAAPAQAASPTATPTETPTTATEAPEAEQQTPLPEASGPPPEDASVEAPTEAPTEQKPVEELVGLHVISAAEGTAPAPLGSLDPREGKLFLEFSANGAGFEQITLSEFWQTAAQSRKAKAHYAALARGETPPRLPSITDRYILQTALPYDWFKETPDGQWVQVQTSIPLLAAHSVILNDQTVRLLEVPWTETARDEDSVTLEVTIADADDRPIAQLLRRFKDGTGYDFLLDQRVTNLTDAPLRVQWVQYGPGDLIVDRSRYMDRRRFHFGYLPDPVNHPDLVTSADQDVLFDRTTVIRRAKKAAESQDPQKIEEYLSLWPNAASRSKGYSLSWFASTNRYFALAVHPVLDVSATGSVTGSRSLEQVVSDIRLDVPNTQKGQEIVFTGLYSPVRTIAPGADVSFDMGVYAGPQDPKILADQQPMAALRMKGLILYQMSSMCAFCTFQWLAIGLLNFLSGVHYIIGDWGVAIILLVIVVRALLHPLTKRAQVNMQRFGKAMGEIKPEIEKLQKKYPNDAKKLQQEQMRLMRERGANPFQMLGCLPMFLQMPIWVALYAMLYFAFQLRHEPAFWGFFQLFWHWPFLADLSAADHFFWEFAEPFRFFIWNVTGINLLPILMGVVFYAQQKYMSPPPSPSMTKEQIQQQKIMKVMMVVLFPVMLYSAPSGLTLYIFTSSLIGIVESKYVRAHIKAMDLEPPKKKKPRKKPKDLQSRMYADAMERAKQKAEARKKGPPKRYKRRK